MDLPESLPARVYLLAYDAHRGRMTASMQLGYMLRAAALSDLLLAGALTDDSGKAGVRSGPAVADPVVASVHQQIAASRPRSWRYWVNKGNGPMKRVVRDQLASEGWIRVEPRRILGIFPGAKVTVPDTLVVERLTGVVSAALRDPIGQVDPRDGALVALAAAGELNIVLPRRRRREHKERIERLGEYTGPVAKALRKVLQQTYAAAGSAGSAA
jgi:hypothetical protein